MDQLLLTSWLMTFIDEAILDLPTSTLTRDFGPTVGLESELGVELDAPWYERKPWAFEVRWTVSAGPPGLSWHVLYMAQYDEAGQVTRRSVVGPLDLCPGDSISVSTDIRI